MLKYLYKSILKNASMMIPLSRTILTLNTKFYFEDDLPETSFCKAMVCKDSDGEGGKKPKLLPCASEFTVQYLLLSP